MIITGGENVWPSRIERRLDEHPAIAEVAVIGRPDPDWGQTVVACVVADATSTPPSLDEIRAFVTETMPVWNAPKELLLFDELPKTALGKVRRNELLGTRPQ